MVVAQIGSELFVQAEGLRAEAGDEFLLAVDGLALDQDGAQQDAQGLGVRNPRARIGIRNELLEEPLEAEAIQEVG